MGSTSHGNQNQVAPHYSFTLIIILVLDVFTYSKAFNETSIFSNIRS